MSSLKQQGFHASVAPEALCLALLKECGRRPSCLPSVLSRGSTFKVPDLKMTTRAAALEKCTQNTDDGYKT